MSFLIAASLGLVMGCLVYFSLDMDRALKWMLIAALLLAFVPICKDLWLLAKLHWVGDFRVYVDLQVAQMTEGDVWAKIGRNVAAYLVALVGSTIALKRAQA